MNIRRFCQRALLPIILSPLLALGSVGAAYAQSASLLRSFSASFMLTARDLDIGTMQWELTALKDGQFVFSNHSEAIGIAKLFRDERIDERSEWQSAGGRVRPLHYSYKRAGGKRDREVQVDFDWRKSQVRNTLNGKSWTMPLSSGTLDKLVYVIAMMNDLADGVRETRYAVADGGRTKEYRIKVVREEPIDTVLGPLLTTVVERTQSGKSRMTRIWCAEKFHFLPVRIEHIEDDGTVTVTLTKLADFVVN